MCVFVCLFVYEPKQRPAPAVKPLLSSRVLLAHLVCRVRDDLLSTERLQRGSVSLKCFVRHPLSLSAVVPVQQVRIR